MGQKPVPPLNIPIPTKIKAKMGLFTYSKMVALVLPHSHLIVQCVQKLVLLGIRSLPLLSKISALYFGFLNMLDPLLLCASGNNRKAHMFIGELPNMSNPKMQKHL